MIWKFSTKAFTRSTTKLIVKTDIATPMIGPHVHLGLIENGHRLQEFLKGEAHHFKIYFGLTSFGNDTDMDKKHIVKPHS